MTIISDPGDEMQPIALLDGLMDHVNYNRMFCTPKVVVDTPLTKETLVDFFVDMEKVFQQRAKEERERKSQLEKMFTSKEISDASHEFQAIYMRLWFGPGHSFVSNSLFDAAIEKNPELMARFNKDEVVSPKFNIK